jgi:hypothetical protein
MQMIAAGMIVDRATRWRCSTPSASIGLSDGWAAAHPTQAAAGQATLDAVARLVARLAILRGQELPDSDHDCASERMTNEGGFPPDR